MGKAKRIRVAAGRRQRRQLPPLGLEPDTPGNGRPYYAVVVDVHHDPDEVEDAPWSARITGDPSEEQHIAPQMMTDDTLAGLWRDTHDLLQDIGDEVNNVVGATWTLDGDRAAWMELHDRERLSDVAVGVPGGLPTHRYRVGVDEEASALPVPPRLADAATAARSVAPVVAGDDVNAADDPGTGRTDIGGPS